MAPRLRGAHAHDEAQAPRRQRQVRGRDRSAVRLTAPARGSEAVGTALAAASAFSFAVTIAANRWLAKEGLDVTTVLGARFAGAAAVLLGVLAARRGPVLPAPGERGRVLALGAAGYMAQSSLFYLALERGTAAAVSLLFYAYPAMVTVIELAFGWERAARRVLVALALSAAGVAMVVAGATAVTISRAGVLLALAAAAGFAVYLLSSDRLIERTDSLAMGAWVAAGAGVSFLVQGVVGDSLRADARHAPALALTALATASAFVLLFAALRRMGPTRTSVVLTLEAVFAIVLAGVFLDEGLRPLQAAGGAAIVVATALVAVPRRVPTEA